MKLVAIKPGNKAPKTFDCFLIHLCTKIPLKKIINAIVKICEARSDVEARQWWVKLFFSDRRCIQGIFDIYVPDICLPIIIFMKWNNSSDSIASDDKRHAQHISRDSMRWNEFKSNRRPNGEVSSVKVFSFTRFNFITWLGLRTNPSEKFIFTLKCLFNIFLLFCFIATR